MRIISCASYYGTGSSAITNLLEEYKGCMSLTDYEFRFVQDPDGISDLEFHLVENHHRHNSGHALKKYKRLVEQLGNPHLKKYEYFFNNQWKKISETYINNLTEFTYKGYWHQDVLDRGKAFYIWKRCCNKFMQKIVWRNYPERAMNEMPNEMTYCSSPTEEEFLSYTKTYIEQLFEAANSENKENIMVDQIVPPSNLKRYLRYFNDIKVFVVDRDPRDVYLSEKYIYGGRVVPTESVELFCKWYRYTRKHRDVELYDESRVMFVRFEDLIYHYKTEVKRIETWLGFSEQDHVAPCTHLKPEISMRNTRLWNQFDGVEEDMRYIEKMLPQYLYDYSKVNE